jgi:uncharacterized protein (TIGR02722 family)
MVFRKWVRPVVVLAAFMALTSCASTKVTRVSSDTQIDLSGRWNDTDAQMVANAMINDVVSRPWISDFMAQANRKPVVIVGDVRNRTDEHIDPVVFTKSLERELLNSGKVKFVASSDERSDVRAERASQQGETSPETMKKLGDETGADFYLGGVITSVIDASEGQKVVFYKINLELTNIQTNEKVWIGDKEIKKIIDKNAVKW